MRLGFTLWSHDSARASSLKKYPAAASDAGSIIFSGFFLSSAFGFGITSISAPAAFGHPCILISTWSIFFARLLRRCVTVSRKSRIRPDVRLTS